MIISGMGSLSALGSNSEEIWKHYQNGTTRITNGCFNDLDTPVGKLHPKDEASITQLREENSHYKRLDKTVLLGILAGRKAFQELCFQRRKKAKCACISHHYIGKYIILDCLRPRGQGSQFLTLHNMQYRTTLHA